MYFEAMKWKLKKYFRHLFAYPGSLPNYQIQIEVTGNCNLNCRMCPRKQRNVPDQHMSLLIFQNVLDRIGTPYSLALTGWGEFMTHPSFKVMVETARRRLPLTRLSFTTSGLPLSSEYCDWLGNVGVDRIIISLDSAQNQASERYFGHPNGKLVMSNIQELIRSRNGKLPEVYVKTVLQRGTEQVLTEIVEFCASAGVDCLFLSRLDIRHDKTLVRPSIREEQKMILHARSIGKKRGLRVFSPNRQSLVMRLAGNFDRQCLLTMDSAYVTMEGKVTPCCELREYIVGDLFQSSLHQIWRGPDFQAFRKNQMTICDGCDYIKSGQF